MTVLTTLVLLLLLTAPVAVFLTVGRLTVPREERLPMDRLGARGWLHTLVRGNAVLTPGLPRG